jgi:Ca2+/Na+ antiporter
MKILKIAFHELVGMFIDDGALALAAFFLILFVIAAVKLAVLNGLAAAMLLLIGCIVIVAESVSRAARKRFRRRS